MLQCMLGPQYCSMGIFLFRQLCLTWDDMWGILLAYHLHFLVFSTVFSANADVY